MSDLKDKILADRLKLQKENTDLKKEVISLKEQLRLCGVSCPVPYDVLDLLRTIANSDDRIYREKARDLLRRYCN